MIAQLMAQRMLAQNPDVVGAFTLRQAIKLCASPKATLEQLAGMQAALASNAFDAEIADLCQQALSIRRAALAANQPRVKFSIAARGRLVGA